MSAITLPFIQGDLPFPSPQRALDEPDGLLCFGGDLSVNRLVAAYSTGIFPWFSEGEPVLWWSPSVRSIIHPDNFHCSRSLRRSIRRKNFSITVNTAFEQVMRACADIPRGSLTQPYTGTWITANMQQAYINLHGHGYAHSIEVWQQETLVGGLYGVLTANVFCGESMFHIADDASKVAMFALVSLLKSNPYTFIDCQLPTDHLNSLGAENIPRDTFMTMLNKANKYKIPASLWQQRELIIEV